jgi:hypothetical protein
MNFIAIHVFYSFVLYETGRLQIRAKFIRGQEQTAIRVKPDILHKAIDLLSEHQNLLNNLQMSNLSMHLPVIPSLLYYYYYYYL